jgi:hypothetical protein
MIFETRSPDLQRRSDEREQIHSVFPIYFLFSIAEINQDHKAVYLITN